MGTEFTQDEAELRDNYVALHESSGQSYDAIADRLETYSDADKTTAAKVRALAHSTGAKAETTDTKPRRRRSPAKSTAAPAPDGVLTKSDVTAAKKAAPAKKAD